MTKSASSRHDALIMSTLSRHDALTTSASSRHDNGISAWNLRSKKVEYYDDLKYVGPSTSKIVGHYRSFYRCRLRG